jgi:hypothetical protein
MRYIAQGIADPALATNSRRFVDAKAPAAMLMPKAPREIANKE